MGNNIIFWRCCLSGRFPILHTEIQFSATVGNKGGEMQKVILEESMYANINIKVLTTFSPGPKSNSQVNFWVKRTQEGAPNIGPTWDPRPLATNSFTY